MVRNEAFVALYFSYQIVLKYYCLTFIVHVRTYCPTVFLESYIISIPKNNKGSLTTSNNYRGISLCNALTKVLDLIVIDKHHYLLNSSHLQFGFKSNHSTAQCVTVFKEVINHYLNRNTNVYCCFIDATKAFDRVHFGILFNILLSHGIPAIILRLLLHLYTSQKVFVKWQDSISSCFIVQNGVRQGAIISSLLFSLYIDVLISRLKDIELAVLSVTLTTVHSGMLTMLLF